MPGAFTGTCSRQIPTYISLYDKFKEKGVNDVYVVAVNDVFTMKCVCLCPPVPASLTPPPSYRAWKEKLAPEGTRASSCRPVLTRMPH